MSEEMRKYYVESVLSDLKETISKEYVSSIADSDFKMFYEEGYRHAMSKVGIYVKLLEKYMED